MSRIDASLAARLRAAEPPGPPGARERAWELVAAAYAEREPVGATRRRGHAARFAALAAAACVAVGAVALSPPGEAVGQWLRDVVRPAPSPVPAARPSVGRLPGGGRLLVVGPTGPWIVQRDGSRRRLGAYDDATFSPRGLYVAVTRGRMLAAVDLRGGVRWSLTAGAHVADPAWSPDGFRIAYRAGSTLRVVYGDGARDGVLAARSAPAAPAWRPRTAAHQLAFAAAGGVVALRDADTGRELWRTRLAAPVRELAWAPDGRRLLALTSGTVAILGARGRVRRNLATAAGTRIVAARWLRSGRTIAVLRTGPGAKASEVVLVRARARRAPLRGRRLLAVPGRLDGMLASPDGHALLLAAPDADQWLVVRIGATGHISARSGVARQFDPAARSPGRSPRLAAWIP